MLEKPEGRASINITDVAGCPEILSGGDNRHVILAGEGSVRYLYGSLISHLVYLVHGIIIVPRLFLIRL